MTCSTGKFYFGNGELTYKFDLPFGVQPHGMTLDQSLGTIVMGANCSEKAEKIAYAVFPYESYALSYSGLPADTTIKAVRWI